MKAILIDVIQGNVRQVEVDDKNIINEWYKYVGCSWVESVYINSHDSIMVDEEGLLSLTDESKFFSFKGNVYEGNGLVVGVDEKGESVDPCITTEEVRACVKFYTINQVKSMF